MIWALVTLVAVLYATGAVVMLALLGADFGKFTGIEILVIVLTWPLATIAALLFGVGCWTRKRVSKR